MSAGGRWIVALSLTAFTAGCAASTADPSRAARAMIVQRGADAVRAECQNAAAGDWERWQRQTVPYREALKRAIDTVDHLPPVAPYCPRPPLEGFKQFPLFEGEPVRNLVQIYDPESVSEFRRSRAVVAADRWLRRRGIDLIFVPVPKMTSIYVEHFVDPAPADGVIAPHLRRTLFELLEADVEGVDAFAVLRSEREPNPEYLYNTADTHWAPRGMRVVAREVARRLSRYDFGAAAKQAAPVVQSSSGPYDTRGYVLEMKPGEMPRLLDGWIALNARQRALAERYQTRTCDFIRVPDSLDPPTDPRSPVLLIGHSYAYNFREILTKEANLLLRSDLGDHNTTEAFADFLRDSSLLSGVRVIVWVTTEKHMTEFKPMPPPILAALEGSR
jgi:hypothetical protein